MPVLHRVGSILAATQDNRLARDTQALQAGETSDGMRNIAAVLDLYAREREEERCEKAVERTSR